MCGIFGAVSLGETALKDVDFKSLLDILEHRGPDDSGFVFIDSGRFNPRGYTIWEAFSESRFSHLSPLLPLIDSPAGSKAIKEGHWDVFLGHRRLAVIDPTPTGHQPMSDPSRTYWIIYNGEIYNFSEIREELLKRGYQFRGRSDTEVVLFSYIEWGAECVKKFNGMFALAIWDGKRRELFLARDRYGIKPLYYTIWNQLFLFSSEIKAILAWPGFPREVNLTALNEYFTFQNLFRYHTLFEKIFLLPPANIAFVSYEKGFRQYSYWDYHFVAQNGSRQEKDILHDLHDLLRQSVKRQLVSDVPLGSYLSGGMDSGSIVALASQEIPRLATFTAGFEVSRAEGIEKSFDERRDAELISYHFGTEHYEQVIHAGDISWALPKVVWHLEDLRLGMSYPNFYISRLASRFVKVCLSGGGGDELFGGYPWRYYRVFRSLSRDDFLRQYYDFWQRLIKDEDKRIFFHSQIWQDTFRTEPFEVFSQVFTYNPLLKYDSPEDHVANCLYFEAKTFLHGLFIVGDKLSMANSLEERFPFMDNDLVDFAMQVPVKFKLGNLEKMVKMDENELNKLKKYYFQFDDGKNILRKAMSSLLPPEITWRRKQGFSPPEASWYRDENAAYVKELLLDPQVKYKDYINPSYLENILKEHFSGKTNHRLLIWSLLCFETWLQVFFD